MPPMKGAFVVFQTPAPVPTDIVVFQFNGETLTRKVEPPRENSPNAGASTKGSGGSSHQTRAPTETLTVTIELDAADRLETGDAITTGVGLHPALAQLPHGGVGLRLRARVDHAHVRPAPGQLVRDGAPQPRPTARHQRHPLLQLHHALPRSRLCRHAGPRRARRPLSRLGAPVGRRPGAL